MPRSSKKQLLLKRLDELSLAAIKHGMQLKLLGLSSLAVDEFLFRVRDLHRKVSCRRYLYRPRYRKRTNKFELLLSTEVDDSLSDSEFLFHFRVNRDCFWEIVNLIKHHSAFQCRSSDSRGPPPKPACHQLLVLLKYYGCEGNSATSIAISNFFGIGAGMVDDCRNNALSALLSLEAATYIWPDADERKSICARIKEKFLFPNCVGFIDGTLLPLASRPLLHGENYLSRKRFYAIVMLIVCDDNSRILYYQIGWPGSVHDNRVWRNCRLYKKASAMFSNRQYLLGDSAFTASEIMIPPFKTVPGGSLSNNKTNFNTLLAKPRVKSEHCIGILKGRFPFLRQIRLKLGNKHHMKRIIDYVRGAVVLHNFLIGQPFEDEWLNDVQEEGEDDLEPEAGSSSNKPNYRRRDELLYYLSELDETVIN